MDYGKILTKAWHTIWNNKILWIFGILAGFGASSSGSGGSGNQTNFNYQVDSGEMPNLPPEVQQFFSRFETFFEAQTDGQIALYFVLFFLVILVLSFLFFLVRTYGQVGLVRGVLLAEDKDEKLTWSEVAGEIKPFFWRLVGFHVLLTIAYFVIFAVITVLILLFGVATKGILLICLIPLICLLVPLSWIITVMIKQAIVAMLVDDLTILDALRQGYEVVRMNVVSYLVMGLILMLGGGLVGIIISVPLTLTLAPMFVKVFNGYFNGNWDNLMNGVWLSLGLYVLVLPFYLVLRGMLTSYTDTAWVYTYQEVGLMNPPLFLPEEDNVPSPLLDAGTEEDSEPDEGENG